MPDNEKQSKEWEQTITPNATTAASTPSVSTVSVIIERISESKWTKAGIVITVAVAITLFLLQHYGF
jgi:hypothetical protein